MTELIYQKLIKQRISELYHKPYNEYRESIIKEIATEIKNKYGNELLENVSVEKNNSEVADKYKSHFYLRFHNWTGLHKTIPIKDDKPLSEVLGDLDYCLEHLILGEIFDKRWTGEEDFKLIK